MHTLRVSLLALVVLALSALTASAQGAVTPGTLPIAYTPNTAYSLSWDASEPKSAAPEDAVVGYEVASFRELAGGVTVKTWGVGLSTSFAVPGSELGAETQYISVRGISANGLRSTWSNAIPFVPASAPTAPGRLRRTATPTP
jgi:hypothetical protein